MRTQGVRVVAAEEPSPHLRRVAGGSAEGDEEQRISSDATTLLVAGETLD